MRHRVHLSGFGDMRGLHDVRCHTNMRQPVDLSGIRDLRRFDDMYGIDDVHRQRDVCR